jgi:hypothetical protein
MNDQFFNHHPLNLDISDSISKKSQNFNVILNEMLEKEKTKELSIVSRETLRNKQHKVKRSQTYLKINEKEILLTEIKSNGKHITKINLEEMAFYQHIPSMKKGEFVVKDSSFVDEFQILVKTIVEKVENGDYVLMRKE